MTALHCGRLDDHAAHTFTVPAARLGHARKAFDCNGAPLIEGGYYAEWDVAQDELEDRLDREKREAL